MESAAAQGGAAAALLSARLEAAEARADAREHAACELTRCARGLCLLLSPASWLTAQRTGLAFAMPAVSMRRTALAPRPAAGHCVHAAPLAWKVSIQLHACLYYIGPSTRMSACLHPLYWSVVMHACMPASAINELSA